MCVKKEVPEVVAGFKKRVHQFVKEAGLSKGGWEVSEDEAFNIFCRMQREAYRYLMTLPVDPWGDGRPGGARTMPISGLGIYEIIDTRSRGADAGMARDESTGEWVRDESLPVKEFVPRGRFFPSADLADEIEAAVGCKVPSEGAVSTPEG